MNIFLSCVKSKRDYECATKDMYISDLFKKSYRYAETLGGNIYILSAKYGLLEPNDVIAPYNQTLVTANIATRKRWAYMVCKQMERKGIDYSEQAIFLCGKHYREFVMRKFKNATAPLSCMGIGEQLKFYKERTPQ